MASYPSSLPGPIIAGYGVQTQQTFARTQFISGRSQNRKLYSFVPQFVTAQFWFSYGEARIFESWFNSTNYGEEWFDIGIKLPTGFENRQCRFTEMYQGPIPDGPNKLTYTVNLEVRERITFDYDTVLIDPLGVEYAEDFDIAVNSFLPD